MVRIGVISDTHGSAELTDLCIKKAGEVDGWFHLGDFVSDARRIAEKTGLPVYSVLGNCNSMGYSELREDIFPEPQKLNASERVVKVERARIFLCHGHRYSVEWEHRPMVTVLSVEQLPCRPPRHSRSPDSN